MSIDFGKDVFLVNEDNAVDLVADNLPPIAECVEFLYADPRIKYFFEVTLPAAKERKEVLGHILFVCPDNRTREYFLRVLENQYPVSYRVTAFNAIEQPGDLAALMTNLNEHDALVCEAQSANIPDSLVELFSLALPSFALDIIIGKGPSANSIRLDLPQFTFVASVANESSSIAKLLPFFEYVLKVDSASLPKLCAAQLKSAATAASVSIDDAACDLIISKARYDVTQSERYLKRILEYIATQSEKVNRITGDLAEYVFDISGMAVKLETPSDEEEMFTIFRDIRDTLHLMQNELHQMREEVSKSLDRIEEAVSYLGNDEDL
jgi:Holliday junction DNA helicase RuvB